MVEEGLCSGGSESVEVCHPALFVMTAMEQLWVKEFYNQQRENIFKAFEQMMSSVRTDRQKSLTSKRNVIMKAYKLLRKIEKEQGEKDSMFMLAESMEVMGQQEIFDKVELIMIKAYNKLLTESIQTTKTLVEFQKLVKSIRKIGLVPVFLESRFFDLMIKYVHQSFVKEFSNVMEQSIEIPL